MSQVTTHLNHLDGVMMGRKIYEDPWFLSEVDQILFKNPAIAKTRMEVLQQMLPYIEKEIANGEKLSHITRHLVGLYKGKPGGRKFRRHIADFAHKEGADHNTLVDASRKAHESLATNI